MLKGTEKALLASIKHRETDGLAGRDMHGDTCALCERFSGGVFSIHPCIRSTGKGSEKCPVYKKSGQLHCLGTPYKNHPTKPQAEEMIKFLKGLLP